MNSFTNALLFSKQDQSWLFLYEYRRARIELLVTEAASCNRKRAYFPGKSRHDC